MFAPEKEVRLFRVGRNFGKHVDKPIGINLRR